MSTKFELELRGRLGVGCELNELSILNRIIRLTPLGLEYEADPRHVELISTSLELRNCKPVCSPGVKNPDAELEAPKGNKCDATNGEEAPQERQ